MKEDSSMGENEMQNYDSDNEFIDFKNSY